MDNNGQFSGNSETSPKHLIRIELSAVNFFKLAAFLIICFLLIKIFPLVLLFLLGILIAGSLNPLVVKLQSKGVPRVLSVGVIAVLIIAAAGTLLFVIFPSMAFQISEIFKNLPKIQNDVLAQIPPGSFHKFVQKSLQTLQMPDAQDILAKGMVVATETFNGLIQFFLILLFSIYILADNGRAYRWLRDFFSAPARKRLDRTVDEISKVVIGYVSAQFVTSCLGALYVYIAMKLLQVPAALTLAFFAGLFDVLPVLGFFLAVVPALLLSLTVSPATAAITLGLYALYHLIENYMIIPFIYGNRMKVTSMVVLLSLLIAGHLGGVIAMIIILPIVASYPLVEKIWLTPYLGRETVQMHRE